MKKIILILLATISFSANGQNLEDQPNINTWFATSAKISETEIPVVIKAITSNNSYTSPNDSSEFYPSDYLLTLSLFTDNTGFAVNLFVENSDESPLFTLASATNYQVIVQKGLVINEYKCIVEDNFIHVIGSNLEELISLLTNKNEDEIKLIFQLDGSKGGPDRLMFQFKTTGKSMTLYEYGNLNNFFKL